MTLRGVADTHAIIWYLNADHRLSPKAKRFVDNAVANQDKIGISPVTIAEIVYLTEGGRMSVDKLDSLLKEMDRDDTVLMELPFDCDVAVAMKGVVRSEIPDLPDRMIAATALRFGVPLITRDHKIKLSGIETIW